ncbi:MAG: endolytic transglycosylase MltG [Firmicutes bacterium]|nr:endolytic transglycosylase MltG [Bacillota bacterium]
MNRRGLLTLAITAGSLLVLGLVVVLWPVRGMYWQTAGRPGEDIRVVIPQGASTDTIGRLLAQQGVIGSTTFFRLYLALSGRGRSLQAGDYLFSSGLTIPQVVSELSAGDGAYNTVIVTIPEGFTVRQIAQLLAKDKVCSEQAFMHEATHGMFSQYPFWKFIATHNKYIRDRLEGYLFPNTYYFLRNESPVAVIDKILSETSSVLTPVMRTIKKEHLTLPEVMTVASMIEKEAKLASDRPLIASVIYNRLHLHPPMKLQIDSTTDYALGGITVLTDADLQSMNPYNTYTHAGLPPGPIANPGWASIEAAIHPAHTDYYYYVAKGNGSGGSYFAVTYAQQLANIARRESNLAKRASVAHSPTASLH